MQCIEPRCRVCSKHKSDAATCKLIGKIHLRGLLFSNTELAQLDSFQATPRAYTQENLLALLQLASVQNHSLLPLTSLEAILKVATWPQEGRDANSASYGLVNGACGFGALNRSAWPYWAAAAIPRSSPIATSGNAGRDGCGACIRITCTQNVRMLPSCA